MNPWSVVIGMLAIGCLIVAYKGTEDNVISAVIGRPYGNSRLTKTPGATPTLPPGLPVGAGGVVPGLN